MKRAEQKNTFFGGVAVLMIGIAIVKVIGALYKIPISNILGDEGNGHFNNAYVIYNLLLMVSTAGLPIALSKTISEAHALGWRTQVARTFRVALLSFLVLGVISFAVMYQFAKPLAVFQGDGLAALAVRALAPACFFVCIISAYRGYAQGHANMVPTSVSQVIEALGKLLIGVALAWYFMKGAAGTEVAAAGAIFGVTAGACLALIFLIANHYRHRDQSPLDQEEKCDSYAVILKRLMIIAIPITIGASIVPVTTWLDTVQVQNILREVMGAQSADFYKLNELADPVVSLYGAYQRPMTIFNLPSSFMVALTACIIPAISACMAKRDREGTRRIAESSLRMGMLLALPAGIGMTVLASPIMKLLFFNTDHAVTDPSMAILGIASIFICLMLICNALLQSAGFVNLPIFAMLIGCIAKLLVNNMLVRREAFGIVGAPVGTLVCYVLVAGLELLLIKRVMPKPPSFRKIFIKPLLASLAMGAGAWATFGLSEKLLLKIPRFAVESNGVLSLSFSGNALGCMLAILVAVVLYGVLIVALRAISRDDLMMMPKGDKIARLLRLPANEQPRSQ